RLIRKLVNGKVPVSKRYFKTRQLSVNCLAGKSNSVPTNWVKVTAASKRTLFIWNCCLHEKLLYGIVKLEDC
ncbi:hypothetical protein, partial [Lacticaseibacillus sp. N501-2]|uniref:hypothetical protein n=1 Tax=Lacticaseibacillus salsurae TaxID=3367729 RepID=UPI0038B22FFB